MNVRDTLTESVRAVMPLALIIVILRCLMAGFTGLEFYYFVIGVLLTAIGFTLFLVGVKLSLLPIGEMIGRTLISRTNLWYIVVWGAIMGLLITIAEPGVQIYANQVYDVSTGAISKWLLVLTISLGVGIFLGLSFLRTIYRISLIWILLISYSLVFILGLIVPREFIAIAFDAGGVTTGPMTVPFILALGVGLTSIMNTIKETKDNFGFIALASIGPILAVLILGVIYKI